MDASQKIDEKIASYNDWRSTCLQQLRDLIHRADPEITEDWKWNTAVFSKNGLVCAINGFKDHVKINFFKGASLPDPAGIITSGLDSKDHRSIDYFKDDTLNESALIGLVKAAVAVNTH